MHKHAKLSFASSISISNQITPKDFFSFSDPVDERRIPPSHKDWEDDIDGFLNWVRYSCLESASSYFEIYLATVCSLALESDPGVETRHTRSLDGIHNLKTTPNYSKVTLVEDITKGSWSSRIKAYRRVFGHVPATLSVNLSHLDHVRKLRNKFAHGFGRDISVMKAARGRTSEANAMETITLLDLKTYLGMFDTVAKAVDEHLYHNHIGDYEIVYLFHEYLTNPPIVEIRPGVFERVMLKGASQDKAHRFKKLVGELGVLLRSKDYFEQMVRHYYSV
ncbi:hypothetical protein [Paenibacillus sp. FSL P2-0136]|uniref:hypothetical protein n=1 Tax=unclassified Paenibacillus TaxID=185978 RepID=UPI0030D88F76